MYTHFPKGSVSALPLQDQAFYFLSLIMLNLTH